MDVQVGDSCSNQYIQLEDKIKCEFYRNFHLILRTKLTNPPYKTELKTQTTLIIFTVTRVKLEEQLLTEVSALMKQKNLSEIKLKQLEDNMLFSLSAAQGNFVGDSELVEQFKSTAGEIQCKELCGGLAQFKECGRQKASTTYSRRFHISLRQGQEMVMEEDLIRLSSMAIGLFSNAEPASAPEEHVILQGILEDWIQITRGAPTGILANLHAALYSFDQLFMRNKSENMMLGSDDTALQHQTTLVINLILLLRFYRTIWVISSVATPPMPESAGSASYVCQNSSPCRC
ncbi:hypothetical protein ASZ78_008301 [Callipepla squamata]|uniref:Dynein heavy chain ATP-binding dynein motor region domain-containing protein n=1 Tax=Callipepla squamata TaxID=9009 RepID=A0A226MMU7_CALSU|nr:hypothetical protein ASZ78_008301 [Callipepla squamata]